MEKFLALAWAQSKCSINTSPYSFLVLVCLQGSPTLGVLKAPPSGKGSAPCLWEEAGSKQKKRESKQNYCLTGMCAVALYWFYIRVSLRILSGACKCEIGKRHCRTATSRCTGNIKGEEGGGHGGPRRARKGARQGKKEGEPQKVWKDKKIRGWGANWL